MAEEKTIFDEKPDFFYSYIKSVYYEDEELSQEENWERYWENWEEEYKIKRQFEKKYVNDELIEIAREALDNDGIVYGFNHYLKDKASKELYVIQTWDYVPDIRMIKARLKLKLLLGVKSHSLRSVKND